MVTLHVCPCCNRVIGGKDGYCAKYRDSRARRGRLAFLTLVFGLLGCVVYPDRIDMGEYRIIIASPSQVNEHCRARVLATGGMPHDEIRACTDYKTPGKPTIFVSKRHQRCARHEACHAIKPKNPQWCEDNVPCLGEGRPCRFIGRR